ncbi:ribonuclease H-like domain-containing protein [Halorhodospira halochloris]|uniref:ribonuclease H-like domain-containing protein n=1 Tax=Halorhodospira halochloris TaxID=1052 RepID=UPI001EE88C3F|nr:ribonuclease H-like domain-containing protein [Halorhodospira halochloris]MCG5530507.1 ribonuclease H-like domain-containing protein [Halorhodospira halochloris]
MRQWAADWTANRLEETIDSGITMNLAKRLDKLRAQTGNIESHRDADNSSATTIAANTPSPSAQEKQACLRSRLERSRVRSDKRFNPTQRQTPDSQALAELVGGQLLEHGLIEVEVKVGLHSSYGRQPLAALGSGLDNLPEGAQLHPSEAVFLDVETTGLAGGTGTIAFLIGAGQINADSLTIKQWLLSGFGAEPSQLEQLTRSLTSAQGVVTYNGKSFDIPLLKSRARLNGIALEVDDLVNLDLLHPTRRKFRHSWPNCRLVTAEKRLLGHYRLDDLPGAEAPAAWLDYLQRGDGRRLKDVLEHNAADITALAALWAALNDLHAS